MSETYIKVSRSNLVAALDEVWELLSEANIANLNSSYKVIGSCKISTVEDVFLSSLTDIRESTRKALRIVLEIRKAALDKENV